MPYYCVQHHIKHCGQECHPCITTQNPLKGGPQYPPERATMVRRYQYILSRRREHGTNPYYSRKSIHLSLSKESHELFRSRNIL